MAKYASDEYVCKNPKKYVGKRPIIYRSSWEFSMMKLFDEHPNVLAWSSESIQIPYQNPLTGSWTVYIPDFLVVYVDKKGTQHAEMIEVKPKKEMPGYDKKVSKRTKLTQVLNAAKWQAATKFCIKRGIKFRVATEDEMFNYKRKK